MNEEPLYRRKTPRQTGESPPFPQEWYTNPTGCPCLKCDLPYWPTMDEFGTEIGKDTPRPPVDDAHPRVPVRLSLCPNCGNKRCPGAADHENPCSGSNEPGQQGSLYPADPEEELREHYLANKDNPEEWGDPV